LQDFDTRYAAAYSLRSYYAATPAHTSPAHITSLLALYDALNDDDEEVREVASHASQPILDQLLVPLQAATRLTEWLATTFADDAGFRSVVLARMAGDERTKSFYDAERAPANLQLAEALKFDDALFAVEEQNLFVDEVRESERWVAVYSTLSWTGGISQMNHEALVQWMEGGLREIQRLITEDEDGPLGWASRPDVFAICSRILLGSAAMTKNSPRIQKCLREVEEARSANVKTNLSPLLGASFDATRN
jgi:hypothetical protein